MPVLEMQQQKAARGIAKTYIMRLSQLYSKRYFHNNFVANLRLAGQPHERF